MNHLTGTTFLSLRVPRTNTAAKHRSRDGAWSFEAPVGFFPFSASLQLLQGLDPL
jgi:hypothetical protein